MKSILLEILRLLKPCGIMAMQMQYSDERQAKEPDDTNFRAIRYYTRNQLDGLMSIIDNDRCFKNTKSLYVEKSPNAFFLVRKEFTGD